MAMPALYLLTLRRQAAQLAGLINRKVNVIISAPIDPVSQTAAYQRVTSAGIKLVFMDNVVSGDGLPVGDSGRGCIRGRASSA